LSQFTASQTFTHGQTQRTVILLVQLGTPEAATPAALRKYLKEFLSDRRVVSDIPALVWQIILRGIILNIRPRKSAAKYASIWLKEGSPLRVHTETQYKLLKGWLGQTGQDCDVAFAMRYGQPSIASVLQQLRDRGMERLLVLPMYPQYAAATTATVVDAVFKELSTWRNQPEVRTVKHFHDDPAYIEALASHVKAHWQRQGSSPEHLLMTFHGVPRRSLDLGDPYHCECLKTGRLLAERLQLRQDQYSLSFQSRFGKAEWLQPYTSQILKKLAGQIKGRVDVFCPGFVVDCLETLEEIAQEGKEDYHEAGGQEFGYIPCLNDDPAFIAALGQLTTRHTSGWPVARLDANTLMLQGQSGQAQKEAALRLGAKR
jgi:protoporphyrin/coproporphyrin ferrochelatase